MKLSLRLYYTSGSILSEKARQELKALRNQFPNVEFEIEEIDIVFNPSMAEEEGITATPAVIKFSPPPVVKIVSDLTDLAKSLGLRQSTGCH